MGRNRRDAIGPGRLCRASWVGWVTALALALYCASAPAARASDGPNIDKTSVTINTWQVWQTWLPGAGKYKTDDTSWMPTMKFKIEGPLAGGSQLSVEYTKADGSFWVSVKCPTEEIADKKRVEVETPRDTSTDFEKKYIDATGIFGYKIHLKDVLTGTNSVLCSGTFKVGRISRYNGSTITKNHCDYYVDYDWAMPIGYVWLHEHNEDVKTLHAAFWLKRNESTADLAGYVMFNGKEIGSTKKMGSNSSAEQEIESAHSEKGDPKWVLMDFEWYIVGVPGPGNQNKLIYSLSDHPGTYQIKILRGGELTRETSFTVGADGKLVDNGINKDNHLDAHRMIVPAAVHGTADGPWNVGAYKTEAFFGHPLKGFDGP